MAVIITLVIAAALIGCTKSSEQWPSKWHERPSYRRAVSAIAKRQAIDDSIAAPGARSILLTPGTRTPRVIVLLHGLTDSPRQFEAFAYLLRADGNNVYVPRLPRHGLLGSNVGALAGLTVSALQGVADSVIHEATGLGDSVIVVGLSMGGTIGAWIAQEYPVKRVVLIAPAIEPARIPSILDRPIVGLAARLPSVIRSGGLDTTRPDRELGFSSHAVAEIIRLGSLTLELSTRVPPLTKEIVLLINAGDRTVSESASERLVGNWSRHGAAVSIYELPDSLRVPHNVLQAPTSRVGGAAVLALLRTLTYGQTPSSVVHPVLVH